MWHPPNKGHTFTSRPDGMFNTWLVPHNQWMFLGEGLLYPTLENYLLHVFLYHRVFLGYTSKCLFHLCTIFPFTICNFIVTAHCLWSFKFDLKLINKEIKEVFMWIWVFTQYNDYNVWFLLSKTKDIFLNSCEGTQLCCFISTYLLYL